MSFWEFFSNWQGGATLAVTLATIPILSLFVLNSSGKLNVTGWEYNTLHGLYSRVKLFIKNTNQENNQNKADLVVQVPLSEIGSYSKYKWCTSENSQLKKKDAEKIKAASSEEKCELQYFSNSEENKNNTTEVGVVPYLLELITKYLEVQHAANMLLLYDKNVPFTDSSNKGVVDKIKTACNISFSEASKVIKELFLGSSSWTKQCLMSPIIADLNLKLNNSSSLVAVPQSSGKENLTKDKLQMGNLTGVINYGIFDYSSYKKLKEIPAVSNGAAKKNYSLKINWEIPYSLKSESESNGDKCSLEKLHKKTKLRELKLSDIKECIGSLY